MPSRKPGEMQHTSNDVMIFWMVTTCNFVEHVHRPAWPNIGEHIIIVQTASSNAQPTTDVLQRNAYTHDVRCTNASPECFC